MADKYSYRITGHINMIMETIKDTIIYRGFWPVINGCEPLLCQRWKTEAYCIVNKRPIINYLLWIYKKIALDTQQNKNTTSTLNIII